MSEAPRCCRFCGCEDVHSDGFPAIDGGQERRFECGTQWREDGESWIQDRACKGHVGVLYRRLHSAGSTGMLDADDVRTIRQGLQVAIETLQAKATRIDNPES